jgi:NADH:ubiquinone reductase (H+-translocating)
VTIEQSGERRFVPTRTPIWAVGVKASPLGRVPSRAAGVPLDRSGRVMVEQDCSIPGHPDIFVIGDLAHFATEEGDSLPGVAQVAIQQGKYVARLIERGLRGKTMRSFRYFDPGSMATIGRGGAVVQIGRLRLSGWLAWQIWLFVHLMYQLDFENRVLVLVQWVWNFFTGDRSALLMIDTEQPSNGAQPTKYATDTGTWPAVR